MQLGNFSFVEEALGLGAAGGNQFDVVLRGVTGATPQQVLGQRKVVFEAYTMHVQLAGSVLRPAAAACLLCSQGRHAECMCKCCGAGRLSGGGPRA